MKPNLWSRTSLWLATAALGFALAACGGGGGTQDGDGSAFTASPSHSPELPEFPAAPGGGTTPLPVPDATEPEEPSVPDPTVPVPPEEDVAPPTEPAPLARWTELHDIRGLAWARGVLYAVSSESGEIHEIDPTQQKLPRLAAMLEMRGVRALAWHDAERMLYAVRETDPGAEDILLRIDPDAFGADPHLYVPHEVATLEGYRQVESLAYHASSEKLFAVDLADDVLVEIDSATGATNEIGRLGAYGQVAGLAPEPGGDGLVATDREHRVLLTLDVLTGAATLRARHADKALDALAAEEGAFPYYAATVAQSEVFAFDPHGERWAFADILALSHDPVDGRAFGAHTRTGEILKIDPATERRELVGFVPAAGLEGLYYDSEGTRLYAISQATQDLFALDPATAAIQERTKIHGAGAPFPELRSLAGTAGILYAVDRDSARMLTISPGDGHAIVTGSIAPFQGIEGLAFDRRLNAFHAYDNQRAEYVLIDANDPTLAAFVSGGRSDRISGLAWDADGQILHGTDRVGNALVRVNPEAAPSPVGYDQLTGIAFREEDSTYLAFDRNTHTLIQLDVNLGLGIPVATVADVAIEAMTWHPESQRILAAGGDTLYTIEVDGILGEIGEIGGLAPRKVKTLAFDGSRDVLFGVDVAANRLLRIDHRSGEVTVVDPTGPGLGYDSIEALAFDRAGDRLLGIDRITGALVEIDRDTGVATFVAMVDVAGASGAVMAPGGEVIWVVAGSLLVPIDPTTGALFQEVFDIAKAEAPKDAPPVRLLWPQGNVRRDALASCAVEVGVAGQALDLELRCGDHVLHTSAIEPDGTVARFEIPANVRKTLASGKPIQWQVGNVGATFHVLDGGVLPPRLEAIRSHPTMADRTDWERRLVEAWVLDQAGLHTEALVVGLGTLETYPDRPASARAVLRTLAHLGLVRSRLGREAVLRAYRP